MDDAEAFEDDVCGIEYAMRIFSEHLPCAFEEALRRLGYKVELVYD